MLKKEEVEEIEGQRSSSSHPVSSRISFYAILRCMNIREVRQNIATKGKVWDFHLLAMEIIKLFRNYIFKNLIFFQSSNLDLVHIYEKYRDNLCGRKSPDNCYPMNRLFRESYAPWFMA